MGDKEDFDECDIPERKPIGWNYQGINYSGKPKVNGDGYVSSPEEDIEVVEVRKTAKKKTASKLSLLKSSSRREIKGQIRSASQAKLDSFFSPSSPKEKENIQNVSSPKASDRLTSKGVIPKVKKDKPLSSTSSVAPFHNKASSEDNKRVSDATENSTSTETHNGPILIDSSKTNSRSTSGPSIENNDDQEIIVSSASESNAKVKSSSINLPSRTSKKIPFYKIVHKSRIEVSSQRLSQEANSSLSKPSSNTNKSQTNKPSSHDENSQSNTSSDLEIISSSVPPFPSNDSTVEVVSKSYNFSNLSTQDDSSREKNQCDLEVVPSSSHASNSLIASEVLSNSEQNELEIISSDVRKVNSSSLSEKTGHSAEKNPKDDEIECLSSDSYPKNKTVNNKTKQNDTQDDLQIISLDIRKKPRKPLRTFRGNCSKLKAAAPKSSSHEDQSDLEIIGTTGLKLNHPVLSPIKLAEAHKNSNKPMAQTLRFTSTPRKFSRRPYSRRVYSPRQPFRGRPPIASNMPIGPSRTNYGKFPSQRSFLPPKRLPNLSGFNKSLLSSPPSSNPQGQTTDIILSHSSLQSSSIPMAQNNKAVVSQGQIVSPNSRVTSPEVVHLSTSTSSDVKGLDVQSIKYSIPTSNTESQSSNVTTSQGQMPVQSLNTQINSLPGIVSTDKIYQNTTNPTSSIQGGSNSCGATQPIPTEQSSDVQLLVKSPKSNRQDSILPSTTIPTVVIGENSNQSPIASNSSLSPDKQMKDNTLQPSPAPPPPPSTPSIQHPPVSTNTISPPNLMSHEKLHQTSHLPKETFILSKNSPAINNTSISTENLTVNSIQPLPAAQSMATSKSPSLCVQQLQPTTSASSINKQLASNSASQLTTTAICSSNQLEAAISGLEKTNQHISVSSFPDVKTDSEAKVDVDGEKSSTIPDECLPVPQNISKDTPLTNGGNESVGTDICNANECQKSANGDQANKETSLSTEVVTANSEAPLKKIEESGNETPSQNEKDSIEPEKKNKKEEEEEITSEMSRKIMESLMDKWRELKKSLSQDDGVIKEKMWKSYYLCHSTYTHSRKFIHTMRKAVSKLDGENLYVVIKEIVDNLKQYKDVPYIEKKKKEKEKQSGAPVEEEEEEMDEATRKTKRKLAKVESRMIKLDKKIRQLEEAEVDWDDDCNSSYLLCSKLKEQFMRLDDFYCKLADCVPSTGRPVEKKFKYEGSRYPEINMRITAWVNKNKCFPDYQDILHLVRKVTKDKMLPLKPEAIRVQAQEIFSEVGQMLKSRRERDDFFSIWAYGGTDLMSEPDPAKKDSDLDEQLKKNEQQARHSIEKIFQKYVEKELLQPSKFVKPYAKKKSKSKKSKSLLESDSDEDSESSDEGSRSPKKKKVKKERLSEDEEQPSTSKSPKKTSPSKSNSVLNLSLMDEEIDEEINSILMQKGRESEEDEEEEEDEEVEVEEEEDKGNSPKGTHETKKSPEMEELLADEEDKTLDIKPKTFFKRRNDDSGTSQKKRIRFSSPEVVEID